MDLVRALLKALSAGVSVDAHDQVGFPVLPAIGEGARSAGKEPTEVELTVAVFMVAGDTPGQRAPWLERARRQVAFYGSTRNYAFQFDDLGYVGTSAALNQQVECSVISPWWHLGKAWPKRSSNATAAQPNRLSFTLQKKRSKPTRECSPDGERWLVTLPPLGDRASGQVASLEQVPEARLVQGRDAKLGGLGDLGTPRVSPNYDGRRFF